MSLIWGKKKKGGIITFAKWEMEISFISEVGKKNVPETSSINKPRAGTAPQDSSTQQGPRDSAHTDCTILSARTNNAGAFLSCATPGPRCQGVRVKVRILLPSTGGAAAGLQGGGGVLAGGIPDFLPG